jgi:methyl-accepting chemotaxis protein
MQGMDIPERLAKGFKPTVLAVFVVCYLAICLILARLIAPLFRYLRSGEGYDKARVATISIPLWIMGVTFVFWIIGTTAYFMLRNWDAESGLPYLWVLNMKLSGGVMAGLYISILLNIRLIRVKSRLDINDVRPGENDLFSRAKVHLTIVGSAYYTIVHLGYLAYFYANYDSSIPKDIGFPFAFLSTAVMLLAISLGLAIVMQYESRRQTDQLLSRLEDFAAGQADLSEKVTLISFNVIGDLSDAFNRFVGRLAADIRSLRRTVDRLQESSRSVAESAESLAGTSQQQATGTKMIAERTANFSQAMVDIDSHVTEQADIARHNAQSAADQADGMESVVASTETMYQKTRSSIESAGAGFETVRAGVHRNIELAHRMDEVARHIMAAGENSQQVEGVLARITDIAEETNLLAVNASIEAAHAGKSGAGFAIVANEIRSLSATTGQAVEEIGDLLRNIRDSVSQGAELARKAREEGAETNRMAQESLTAVEAIIGVMEESGTKLADVAVMARQQGTAVRSFQSETSRLRDFAQQIKDSVSKQSSGAADIRNLISDLESSQTENVNSSNDLSRLASELAQAGEELARIVNQFKIT